MRKFNEVIEDVKAPNTQSLWLNEGSLSYYGKNGWESIGGSGSSDKSKSSIKEITYSELKELRDNDKLSPGALYRITDYICTPTQGAPLIILCVIWSCFTEPTGVSKYFEPYHFNSGSYPCDSILTQYFII